MRIIVVDDERLALRQFELEIESIEWAELAGTYTNPVDALEYIKEHPVEAVFLDIEMPEMNGLLLSEKMREILPDLVVIFISGYEQYTLDALKVKADYYLTKPYDSGELLEVLKRARLLCGRQKKRVYFRTFGRFEVFIDGRAVYLSNAKARELLALCVDHRGSAVTIEEAVDKLWEERTYDARVKNLYRKAVMQIRQILTDHGVGDVFFCNRGSCYLDSRKVDCDYYKLLEGDPQAIREWRFIGRYLEEYTWAEETNARLEGMGYLSKMAGGKVTDV